MSRTSDAVAWGNAATALALTLRKDTLDNQPAEHWDMMMASLAPPMELSRHEWMVGNRHGADVLVTYYFRDGGSSADTHITYALARIVPPLFLGLEIARRNFFSGIPKIGVPAIDDRFTVKAFLPEHGHAMLAPWREPLLSNVLLDCAPYDVRVCDSYVQISLDRFESNAATLDRMLRDAVAVARACAGRRAALGETALDARFRAEWSHFADAERMTYDHAYRSVYGSYRGDEAGIRLRTSPHRGWITARIALPIAPGFTLTMAPETSLTRFGNVIGFSDIEVGDRAFDREVRLKGAPAPFVRKFFESPETRVHATTLVRKYSNIQISDRWLSVVTPPHDRAAALDGVMTDLSSFVSAAFGRSASLGPYR